MKQGEKEAKQILQSKGVEFDETYCDDNSKPSMPDFKYKDGRFLEVTHTKHNQITLTKFMLKPIEEKIKIMEEVSIALDRIENLDYPRTLDGLTDEGIEQFNKDKKLVESHFGSDEFRCDIPIVQHSTNNIIHEIVKDKAPKYPNGDTDLFIFITPEELESLKYLLETRNWNGEYNRFVNAVAKSPFKVVYLCVYDLKKQVYNTENPTLLKFETDSEQKLSCCML